MKFIAAALMGAALCAWGLYRAATLKKKAACLYTVRLLLEKCGDIIERKGSDAKELLSELVDCQSLSGFSFLRTALGEMLAGMSFADAFFSSSSASGELDSLENEDKQMLADYIRQFSSSTRDKLIADSRVCSSVFEKRAAQAREYSGKTGKLYIASCALSAAIIVIIII